MIQIIIAAYVETDHVIVVTLQQILFNTEDVNLPSLETNANHVA